MRLRIPTPLEISFPNIPFFASELEPSGYLTYRSGSQSLFPAAVEAPYDVITTPSQRARSYRHAFKHLLVLFLFSTYCHPLLGRPLDITINKMKEYPKKFSIREYNYGRLG